MTDSEVLQRYIDFVPFLGEVLGPGVEVVVHDVADQEHSLVAICNSVSGREIGNPITDLARDLIKRGAHSDADYLTNYNGRNKNGEFLSSTYYIKNEGRLIGLLCVNKDMRAVRSLSASVQNFLESFNLVRVPESEFSEDLNNPVASIMYNQISEIIAQSGIAPSRMSPQEKARIVHKMDDAGILMMKGAVQEIANQLGVSVPTVYRYLNK